MSRKEDTIWGKWWKREVEKERERERERDGRQEKKRELKGHGRDMKEK